MTMSNSAKKFFIIWLFSSFLFYSVVNASRGTTIEPFIGKWCADQFPEEFEDFGDMSAIQEGIPIEPFMGKWCFEQFPEDLESIDQAVAISNLYTHHVRIEDHLLDWGTKMLLGQRLELEPHVGLWCAAQWSDQLGTFNPLERYDELKHVPIEPALGEWCFEVFPEELASLTKSSTIGGLYDNHKYIEDPLLAWANSNDGDY
eukprot:CAMPEP_0195526200 /NCGR_PEP_ID=MMETSP0794_2-20130614/27117_1 /TAXON_ID=515487 /ORGANISM="Stephanopyxis turris, Strain CCMP 815" /LENGTH=201 /DNA_ID=CAMNT_0040656829 /DNA_START=81 /DNA_END=686 /DNA_ORIENTATION=+